MCRTFAFDGGEIYDTVWSLCGYMYMDSFLYQWSDILVSKENTCATNIYAADAVPSFNGQNCFEVHMRPRVFCQGKIPESQKGVRDSYP